MRHAHPNRLRSLWIWRSRLSGRSRTRHSLSLWPPARLRCDARRRSPLPWRSRMGNIADAQPPLIPARLGRDAGAPARRSPRRRRAAGVAHASGGRRRSVGADRDRRRSVSASRTFGPNRSPTLFSARAMSSRATGCSRSTWRTGASWAGWPKRSGPNSPPMMPRRGCSSFAATWTRSWRACRRISSPAPALMSPGSMPASTR